MAKENEEYYQLKPEDIEKITGEPLPEKAVMSLLNTNVAIPVNAALALNVLSDSSIAIANAEQTVNIEQSN